MLAVGAAILGGPVVSAAASRARTGEVTLLGWRRWQGWRPRTYRALVVDCGWDDSRFERWYAETVERLLPDRPGA